MPPLELFAAMRQAQPGGFAAYIDTGEEQVLSVSPELFFDWHDGHLITRPMKGTAPRDDDQEADAALAQALRTSPKERAENVMIVDLIRNDLSRIAKPFSVTVDGLCRVQALSTVWQMVSDVHADTRANTRLVDVFGALFPCGSVTGAPKVQAMRLIRELEDTPRGVYCGAVGVVRPGGSATFNVPIRTVEAHAGTLQAGTGSGITADAQAASEWQEWRHKQTFLQRASQSFSILETLALQGGVLQRCDAHLARMKASAAHFGYAWNPAAAHNTLQALCHQHPQGNWRIRLLLDANGTLHAQAYALAPTPATVHLQLAPSPLLETDSEFVRHKTTHRAHYERLEPTTAEVFDTVLWNTHGEVIECTRRRGGCKKRWSGWKTCPGYRPWPSSIACAAGWRLRGTRHCRRYAQRDGHRAIIHQRDLHVRGKLAGPHDGVGTARLLHEQIVQAASLIGCGSSGKAGPVTAPHISR